MFKLSLSFPCFILLIFFTFCFGDYGTITPAALHDRLLANDTLLLLDVREWDEYTAGHIAEPAGRLPLTPAFMPWNTGILAANSHQLPKDIDIIIYCRSGRRSDSASKFLSDSGYRRIFNMTGGFNTWTYDKRLGGFGDGSGHWVRSTMVRPDTIAHDSAMIVFHPASVSGIDSLYCEVHFAYGKQPAPGDAPASGLAGLFRVTVLDRFGLPLFKGDSLLLSDTASIALIPRPKDNGSLAYMTATNLSVLTGPGLWKRVPFVFQSPVFHVNGRVLRHWYNAEGTFPLAVQNAPGAAAGSVMSMGMVTVYDLRGRLIAKKGCASSIQVTSEYYIIAINREHRYGTPPIGSPSITPSRHH